MKERGFFAAEPSKSQADRLNRPVDILWSRRFEVLPKKDLSKIEILFDLFQDLMAAWSNTFWLRSLIELLEKPLTTKQPPSLTSWSPIYLQDPLIW